MALSFSVLPSLDLLENEVEIATLPLVMRPNFKALGSNA